MPIKIDNLELAYLGHASFKLKAEKTIYIDPFQLKEGEKADIILITHPHYDHCSIADIAKIAKDGTIVVCHAACQSTITKLNQKINMQLMQAGDEINAAGIKIKAFPAYNREKQFHPKAEGWLGYLISINGIVIYHAGDTDAIPEMEKLTGFSKKGSKLIALLPVDGNFTMNAEEAAKVAASIKPFIAIPMHFKSENEAKNFQKLCQNAGIRAEILEKE
jgi:L-ascorbate metabolism protein UlaG (beta-lactamase superfamily)